MIPIKNVKNIAGQTFGRLTVINFVDCDRFNNARWLCRCECGNEKIVSRNCLISGKTRSCGCLNREILHQKGKYAIRTTHGLWGTRLYRIWKGIKNRCYNKKSADYIIYGARGITVCNEWKNNFQAFYDWAMSHGYQDNLSTERIDPDGNYSPENCRWATDKEQANNRRSNRFITIGEETKTVAEWIEYSGISRATFYQRLRAGKSGQDLISKPRPRKRVV